MALSTLDMFTVGVGPSSSHTVGPMRAALRFVTTMQDAGVMARVDRVQAELYGSLGATGRGHGSDRAVVLGLQGNRPETVDTDRAQADADEALVGGKLRLAGGPTIVFEPKVDLVLHRRQSLPAHPNGMTLRAFDEAGGLLEQRTYFSVGGGFVVDEDAVGADRVVLDETPLPHPFTTGEQLLATCRETGMSISDVMLANELTWRTEEQVRAELLHIWAVMKQCVQAGCTRTEPLLPGNLRVPRRAPRLLAALEATDDGTDPMRAMDWVGLFALAVNEENASGGRIVTAPTNGAAGIVPAVLHYYDTFVPGADDDGVVRFLLTAAAVGILFKINASISGAEVGCQGEVGSACAMAAAGLCEVMGGTPEQVENAAEIGIEHNLGLTCDPIGGLVQIPCIERNAVASNKAVNAARIAIRGDGSHKVSLDKAILTMRQTGADMKSKYKETSRGGLAVNVIEC
ncbi:L-serine ammonia-lyase [Terracoccus luteus]|uniref:L-serine dehydratase n=1 Tax=Terracoccus luteus TaxID=53356 RepID=A0A839PSS0_9MICO|nr:L-serine ammonia-lyase [Terracoccus luteus]MBB2987230.1 L-serine dehydratase [Terracoccus luteus]MCP2172881.1 L-serine dehydratase [Terracoccus luteus]